MVSIVSVRDVVHCADNEVRSSASNSTGVSSFVTIPNGFSVNLCLLDVVTDLEDRPAHALQQYFL